MEGNQGEAPFLLGKRLAQPPSPIRMGHRNRTLGQTIEDRKGGNRETLQHNVDCKGDYKVGTKKTGEIGEL